LPEADQGAPGAETEEASGALEAAPAEPLLLDMPEGMSAGRIDQGWAPAVLRPRPAPPGSLGWIAGGLVVLLLGWLVLSAVGFVGDQFARSAAMGWSTVLVFGAGLLAVLWGLWREMRSFRQLRQVDTLRALLSRDDGPVGPARALALDWLGTLERIPDPARAREAVATAPDVPLLRAALRRHLAEPLRQATRRAGSQAGLRGLSLLRQVAAIHGMRPGSAVTLALLRRLAWTAAGTSGIDLLGRSFADSALSHLPVLKQLAAALPGSGLAALRLWRLADVTAQACSPIEAPQ
jgi:putative membrane protein